MAKGSVKKLVRDRGFGFIKADDGKEYFFHRNDLSGVNYEEMQEGQAVEFEIQESHKGPRAVKVAPSA